MHAEGKVVMNENPQQRNLKSLAMMIVVTEIQAGDPTSTWSCPECVLSGRPRSPIRLGLLSVYSWYEERWRMGKEEKKKQPYSPQ